MKDYDEMAKSVLKRRDQYAAERSRQRKKTISILSCFCIAALIGVGVWRSGTQLRQETAGIGSLTSDESYASTSSEEETSQAGTADLNGDSDALTSSEKEIPQAGVAALDGDSTGHDSIPAMISSFGETKMDSDISVHNGRALFSKALKGAIAQYGDAAKYRVIVELFSDGAAIDCASDEGKVEMERFAAEGYTVAFECYNDGNVEHNYFTLHATLEQLENFSSSAQYGYGVMLYGERIEVDSGLQEAVSPGTMLASDEVSTAD